MSPPLFRGFIQPSTLDQTIQLAADHSGSDATGLDNILLLNLILHCWLVYDKLCLKVWYVVTNSTAVNLGVFIRRKMSDVEAEVLEKNFCNNPLDFLISVFCFVFVYWSCAV